MRARSHRLPLDRYRQGPTIQRLADYITESPHFGAALLVGSFAEGRADALSDVDLIFIVNEGHFRKAWELRGNLHVTGALIAWDQQVEIFPK